MTYVLFATSRFGALTLESLTRIGFPPVLLVTNPDRPSGRKQLLTPTPAKEVAVRLGIPLLQPEKLEDAYEELRALGADVFVVASFGKILRPELIAIPPKGVVGIHPSLLPLYRGPAPMQQPVLEGATETGVSLFVVDDVAVDHGPVIVSEVSPIPDGETNLELEARMAVIGADLLKRALLGYVSGETIPQEQDHTKATFTRKFVTEDGYVSWEDVVKAHVGDATLAREIRQKIGAFTPEPGVWTELNDQRIKLLAAEVRDGKLVITAYQAAGKLPVSGVLNI